MHYWIMTGFAGSIFDFFTAEPVSQSVVISTMQHFQGSMASRKDEFRFFDSLDDARIAQNATVNPVVEKDSATPRDYVSRCVSTTWMNRIRKRSSKHMKLEDESRDRERRTFVGEYTEHVASGNCDAAYLYSSSMN